MTLTQIILVGTVVSLVLFDIVIAMVNTRKTISMTVYEISEKFPIIPFALGVVIGHILWK